MCEYCETICDGVTHMRPDGNGNSVFDYYEQVPVADYYHKKKEYNPDCANCPEKGKDEE